MDEIKKHTKAASSCGSCTGLVEQILINCVGGAADVKPSSEKPVCGCTSHTHGELRRAIREHHLTRVADVMAFMEWRTPDGCATCRPAINYYLLSTWPGEARDDSQSRLANERMHANIQKDGTYSVVPRMWGGVTNASELRRIADVADKYAIPMVKVTGGQRIDLLGVRKEDLPKVWQDLDMPSGHAYGKSLRTVKTCVGSEFCRFGTQDSTGMGIALEKDLVGMWSPHKVKLAVSGCPRNCAESGIRTWASSRWSRAGSCTWAATAASRPRWPSSSSRCRRRTRCWSTPARSCSSIGRKPSTWNARCTIWPASAWSTPGGRWSRTRKTASSCTRGCASPCPSSPILARERRARPRRARVRDPFRMSAAADRHHHAKLVRDLPGRGHSLKGARIVRRPGREDIAVFRSHGDEVFALIDRCPHKGGPLSAGLVHGRSVTCPLHNWVVDLDSGQAQAPDVGCARAVAVRVEAGVVSLDLD